MKILLTYTSKTGNTRKVAEAIKAVAGKHLVYCDLAEAPDPQEFDAVIIGFWIDKGKPVHKAAEYIQKLKNKKTAFFYTLGASPESDHAAKCFQYTRSLFEGNELVGEFFCQGKVSEDMIEFFRTLPSGHRHALTEENLALYRAAESHPDAEDLKNAQAIFRKIFNRLREV
ncbi:flavodoxin family protein [Syntrophobotulus glycolicus DSM 8271]|uniref:Flavodoxin family protein n=1 Tax=Syntrophobotulus glycolicus (strain DSM 8271 / FlGlyR) TaxID=645991 RepID=F0SWZ9_SYNGF|nr:flavodoxin family protein [Syntrophobotulus glycolicus]ADY55782.1 flavodoxin family protein [Syntrophobotulus glycolicus DSM 8271]